MKRFAPLQDEPIARQYLDLLMQGKVDAIEHDMDPSVADVDVREKLPEQKIGSELEHWTVGVHTFGCTNSVRRCDRSLLRTMDNRSLSAFGSNHIPECSGGETKCSAHMINNRIIYA